MIHKIPTFPASSPHELVILSGAGISANEPTCLPLGSSLSNAVVTTFCGAESLEFIRRALAAGRALWVSDPSPEPRLEVLLEGVVSKLGIRALRILDSMQGAPPNPIHQFFAQHLLSGGEHFTTNIDNCIEAALMQPGLPGLHHIHGRLGPSDGELRRLRIRLGRLTAGLSVPIRVALVKSLRTRKVLLFVGYSGTDYFDVNRFFEAELTADLRHLSVVWISHNNGVLQKASIPTSGPAGRLLRGLQRRGARVLLIQGDTSIAVSEWVAPQLRLEAARARRCESNTRAWTLELTDEDRAVCTAELMSRIGAPDRVAVCLRSIKNRREHALFVWRVAFDRGNYAQAEKLAHKIIPYGPFGLNRTARIVDSIVHTNDWPRARWLLEANLPHVMEPRVHGGGAEELAFFYLELIGRARRRGRLDGSVIMTGRLAYSYLMDRRRKSILGHPHSASRIRRIYWALGTALGKIEAPPPYADPGDDWLGYSESNSVIGLVNRRSAFLHANVASATLEDWRNLYEVCELIGDRPGQDNALEELRRRSAS